MGPRLTQDEAGLAETGIEIAVNYDCFVFVRSYPRLPSTAHPRPSNGASKFTRPSSIGSEKTVRPRSRPSSKTPQPSAAQTSLSFSPGGVFG